MREILFKAKRKDNNEWVYGWIHRGLVGDVWYLIEEYDSKNIEIISETICEYTGLDDKNGAKVFENDIIQIFNTIGDTSEELKIKWDNNMGTYEVLTLNNCHYSYDTKCAIAGCELIGNIYDKEVKQ